jgi:hypothetical protein
LFSSSRPQQQSLAKRPGNEQRPNNRKQLGKRLLDSTGYGKGAAEPYSCMQRPMTLPSRRFGAANNVIVA